jgi:acyl-CoA thioester hydrolase
MPRIFVKNITVSEESIDLNRHVNNIEYLRWMLDIAIEHSAAQGWPVERYISTGSSWVVRSHYIKYARPAFLGDSISVLTWVRGIKEKGSPRKYLFWRARDKKIIAEAETLWVYVDLLNGRPCHIPKELESAFEVVIEDTEDIIKQTCLSGG